MSEKRVIQQQTWYQHPLTVHGRCQACHDIEVGGTVVWSRDPQMPKRWVCDYCFNQVIDPAEVDC